MGVISYWDSSDEVEGGIEHPGRMDEAIGYGQPLSKLWLAYSCPLHSPSADPNMNPIPYADLVAGDILGDYGTYKILNIFDPIYPVRWAEAAITAAEHWGVKNIFADSVDLYNPWGGALPTKTDAQWLAAIQLFVYRAARELHEKGYKFGINLGLGGHRYTQSLVRTLCGWADMVMAEHFGTSRGITGSIISGTAMDQLISDRMNLTRPFVCTTSFDAATLANDTLYEAAALYGFCAYLIGKRVGDNFVLGDKRDTPSLPAGREPFWIDWLAYETTLGNPRATAQKYASTTGSLWVRLYQHGVVYLNTSNVTPGPVAAKTGQVWLV